MSTKAPYGYTKYGNPRRKPTKAQIAAAAMGASRRRAPVRRKRATMRGHGGYFTDMIKDYSKGYANKLGSYAGGALGGMLAPGIGSAAGASLGGALGDRFAQLTGVGDYEVKYNSVLQPDAVVPSFGEDSIRVKKRECIGHIDATEDFTNNVYAINPGDKVTFPWLSQIASNYSQWRMNGLVFQVKSTTSDAIASTTDLGLGQVICATNYDALEKPYQDDIQMLGSTFANSDKPSKDILHAVECAPTDTAQKLYYIRSGSVPTGGDVRLYDMGNFQVATVDMPSDYLGMAQLWVTYDVTLVKSVMNSQLGFQLATDQFTLNSPSTSNPWGSSQTKLEGSNLGCTFSGSSTQEMFFPVNLESGYYSIQWNVSAGTAQTYAFTPTYTNCNVVQLVTNRGESTTNGISCFVVQITARNASVFLGSVVVPTGASLTGNLVVTQVNGEIYS